MQLSHLKHDFYSLFLSYKMVDHENDNFTSVTDFGLTKKEGQNEYVNRINKAINNLAENKGIVTFSEDEFESLINDLQVNK
jgi:hypothetical protein